MIKKIKVVEKNERNTNRTRNNGETVYWEEDPIRIFTVISFNTLPPKAQKSSTVNGSMVPSMPLKILGTEVLDLI